MNDDIESKMKSYSERLTEARNKAVDTCIKELNQYVDFMPKHEDYVRMILANMFYQGVIFKNERGSNNVQG